MTVNELIEMLGQYDGDREVRLATQPTYPLEATVAGVAGLEEIDDVDEDGQRVLDAADEMEPDGPVYVLEGTQRGYASKALWDGCC
jgi:hypothetical protein